MRGGRVGGLDGEHSGGRARRWIPFRGVARDVRRRLPHYASDWTDALQDRAGVFAALSAVAWMYFSTLAPALAIGNGPCSTASQWANPMIELPTISNPQFTPRSLEPYLHPTPFTLHPTPYTLHPTPYTLHPTPYTSFPTLYTLNYESWRNITSDYRMTCLFVPKTRILLTQAFL